MTRRHRINVNKEKGIDELTPLYELLTNELTLVSMENKPKRLATLAHQNLFRLWCRINRSDNIDPEKAKQGKPKYPEIINYGTIKNHVVPFAWSIGVTPPGHPQPQFENPQTVAEAEGILKEAS